MHCWIKCIQREAEVQLLRFEHFFYFCSVCLFCCYFVVVVFVRLVENTCYKTEEEWEEGHILLPRGSSRGRAASRLPFVD